ncbi:MAG: efflux RND transporter periplasmic adaptor subunit [Desulfomicrobium sp.]|nr:efflux RND transporter periplasmic adaptor subunit [Pseudomonadota bacterium]MBV1712091.1 efflux RND transporter periplasmic adaptor subunit [Desulfomicrobium sp.]MBU4572729.1 efflux RND transporter periplasmic adaptor subunit [Pseudomonadota bacterium]MBU4594724.1 efflux RND transporter periplasmic adaptor subunit [Pseudomonadota bacterium]MBV1718661.1 efflux RND transporter periplasmic adaptor subunit [Desulfomicrobium sp.]
MIRKIFLAVLLVAVVAGVLAGIKAMQIRAMIEQSESFSMPAAVVSTVGAVSASWETVFSAVGSVTAVQGVTMTAEAPGKVVRIDFDSGDRVEAGTVLAQLDISEETARLRALEAGENLARVNLRRIESLVAQRSTAKAEYDAALAEHRQILAQMDALKAFIAKKTIRAPFSGILGIRRINLGQNLGDSDVIVTLTRLDQVHVEFSLPQQQVAPVLPGATVRVTTDALPGQAREGRLSAVEPLADSATRTVRMQAELDNPGEVLRPGMFVNVSVVLPEKREVTLIPATAVLYAAYSDSVFVVEPAEQAEAGAAEGLTLRQQFVTLGERRGDFVAVERGLEPGRVVVSTGVFKYRNGQSVVVDNTLAPEFEISPTPENS